MPTPRFLIRLATENDIGSLRGLIEISVRHLQKQDYTPAQIEGALGHLLGLDTQLIADRTYFVATPMSIPELIVGCGGWSFRKTLFGSDRGPDRQDALLNPATESAKIRAIFVHPKWARQGLGTFILKHCEVAAFEAGFRNLEMGSTLTGVPLYRNRGYEALEELRVPLPNGEFLPVIHMVKTLNDR